MPFDLDTQTASQNLSVVGMSVSSANSTGILIAAYNASRYNETAAVVDIELHLTQTKGACADATQVQQYVIDASTSVYDNIWRDLAQAGGLKTHDGRLYKLKHLYNAAGQDFIQRNLDRYLERQKSVWSPAPFNGTVERSGSSHRILRTQAAAPSVLVLVVPDACADVSTS